MKKVQSKSKDCKNCQKRFKLIKINQLFCGASCRAKHRNKKRTIFKLKLIRLKGGECEMCGYKKNFAALCFHHRNPKTKEIEMDISGFTPQKEDKIMREAKKCQLLCCNCHAEIHNELSIL